jgi:hypothetical protein
VAADVRRLANVSAVQPQAAQPAKVSPTIPWYVYVAALLLVGWVSFLLSVWISEWPLVPGFLTTAIYFRMALELTIGVGLLFRRRWAWVLGVVTSVVYIGEGLRQIIFVRGEYVVIDAFIHYLVPALVILVALLPGRARRAFLGE